MTNHTNQFLLRFFLALSGLVGLSDVLAEGWATTVNTPGTGRLELTTNFLLFVHGKDYEAKIPSRINEGERINIKYKDQGKWVDISFVVAAISTDGNLCRLHDRIPSQWNSSSGDTIYVKPCHYK